MNASYEPIACAFHSVLEEAVLRGEPQEIVYRDETGALWCRQQRLADVYAAGSGEFVRLGSGARIRLDRIVRVGNRWLTASGLVRGDGCELAEAVLQAAAREAKRDFEGRLRAAYALGSLAHGGFAPNVSDVDLGLVLDGPLREKDEARVEGVSARIHEAPMPLSGRLSIFWGSLASLRGEKTGGRFPAIDRLDLVRHGRLLAGRDVRNQIPVPDRRTLDVESAKFALRRLAAPEHMEKVSKPRQLLAGGLIPLTKAILLPVRVLYVVKTGCVGESEAAARHYLHQRSGPSAKLVRRGLTLRTEPFSEKDALVDLMSAGLLKLYANLASELCARMKEHGDERRAPRLGNWQRRLECAFADE